MPPRSPFARLAWCGGLEAVIRGQTKGCMRNVLLIPLLNFFDGRMNRITVPRSYPSKNTKAGLLPGSSDRILGNNQPRPRLRRWPSPISFARRERASA
ncbi:hypothetical protein J2W42_001650 [Rhizobium tibeticum]|nr:hypothetical protein [Rhizobium tibeticum]